MAANQLAPIVDFVVLNDRARAVAPEKMGRNPLCQCEPPSEVVDAELAKPEDDRKVRKDPTGVWRWKQCGRCGSLRKKRWRETRRRVFSERDEYVSTTADGYLPWGVESLTKLNLLTPTSMRTLTLT